MKLELRLTLLFIGVSGIAAALVAAVLFLCYMLLKPGLILYGMSCGARVLGIVVYTGIGGNMMLYVGTLLCLYTSWITGNRGNALCLQYISCLYPIAKRIGYCLGQAHCISRSYIATLNYMTLHKKQRFMPKDILIVAPHCLQWDQCPHKITRNIDNCRQCGHCPVGRILTLAQTYHVHFAIATGGTLARQLIQQQQPKLVIAIACERDLISGMNDIAPLPVVGLLNERPNGPCFNTHVNIAALHSLLDTMIGDIL